MNTIINGPTSKGTGLNLSPVIIFSFFALLAVCNIHLVTFEDATGFCFDGSAVLGGEWWRIITHPFVHVSWYHLLLDVTAVTILWHEIRLPSMLQKTLLVCSCTTGSLVTATLYSPLIDQYGLCGLSGTAHGMMFFLGLWWIAGSFNKKDTVDRIRLIAGGTLVGVSGLKSLFEMITGHVVLYSIHTGDLGIPIVESHLGGIVGGLVAFVLFSLSKKGKQGEYKIYP